MATGLRGSFFCLFRLFLFSPGLKRKRNTEIKIRWTVRLRLVFVKSAYACFLLVFLFSSAATVMWCNLIEFDHFDTLNWYESEYTWNNQTLSIRVSYRNAKVRTFISQKLVKREFKMFSSQFKMTGNSNEVEMKKLKQLIQPSSSFQYSLSWS